MLDKWLFKVEVRDREGDVHRVFLYASKSVAKRWQRLAIRSNMPENLDSSLHRGPGHRRGETGHCAHEYHPDGMRLVVVGNRPHRVVRPSDGNLVMRLLAPSISRAGPNAFVFRSL